VCVCVCVCVCVYAHIYLREREYSRGVLSSLPHTPSGCLCKYIRDMMLDGNNSFLDIQFERDFPNLSLLSRFADAHCSDALSRVTLPSQVVDVFRV